MGEEDLEQMEGDVQDSLEDIQYDKVTHRGRWSVAGLPPVLRIRTSD